MLHQTPRNLHFIRTRDRQGLSVDEIYRRVLERMAWDGPYPNMADIAAIVSPRRNTGIVEPPSGTAGAGGSTGGLP